MSDNIIVCPSCKTKLDASTAVPGTSFVCGKCGSVVASAVPPEELEGKVLQGYKILRRIGRGGMGFVYLAEQVSLARKVALKALRTPAQAQEFRREAMAAGSINHPNVVSIYDINEAKGVTFIIMEYVDGVSLRGLLRGHPMPVADTFAIMKQVLSALVRAHRDGFLHRDIKPENILVDKEGLVKVADFGLAQILDETSRPASMPPERGPRRGTPPYLSPEQARGDPCDARTDVYSAGITMYEMLAGERPFAAATPREILRKALAEPLPPLSDANPDVPRRLAKVIAWMCEKSPLDRPDSVEAVLAELDAVEEEMATIDEGAFASDEWDQMYSEAEDDIEALNVPSGPVEERNFRPAIMVAVLSLISMVTISYFFLARKPSGPPPLDPGTAVTPPRVDSPEKDSRDRRARQAYERARQYEKAHPTDFATIVVYYDDAAMLSRGTTWGTKARQRAAAIERRWLAVGKREFEKVRAKVSQLAASDKFQEAVRACALPEGFRNIGLDSEVMELRADLQTRASRRLGELQRDFRAGMDTRNFTGAKQALVTAGAIGTPDAERFLGPARREYDSRLDDAREQWDERAETDLYAILKTTSDHAAHRRYDEAIKIVTDAAGQQRYASIQSKLAKEKAGLVQARDVHAAAIAYLTSHQGVKVRVKGIAGTFREIRDGHIYIDTPAGVFHDKAEALGHKEIAQLAESALAKRRETDRQLALALFLLYDQRFREAERELKALAEANVDVAFYLERLKVSAADGWLDAQQGVSAKRALEAMRRARRDGEWRTVMDEVRKLKKMAGHPVVTEHRKEIVDALAEAREALGEG